MIDIVRPNDEPEPEGGLGGGVPAPMGIRDMRLIERAMRERWDIPEDARKSVPAAALELINGEKDGKKRSPRTRLAAIRAMALLDRNNLLREKQAGDVPSVDVYSPQLHQHHHVHNGETKVVVYIPDNGREKRNGSSRNGN